MEPGAPASFLLLFLLFCLFLLALTLDLDLPRGLLPRSNRMCEARANPAPSSPTRLASFSRPSRARSAGSPGLVFGPTAPLPALCDAGRKVAGGANGILLTWPNSFRAGAVSRPGAVPGPRPTPAPARPTALPPGRSAGVFFFRGPVRGKSYAGAPFESWVFSTACAWVREQKGGE